MGLLPPALELLGQHSSRFRTFAEDRYYIWQTIVFKFQPKLGIRLQCECKGFARHHIIKTCISNIQVQDRQPHKCLNYNYTLFAVFSLYIVVLSELVENKLMSQAAILEIQKTLTVYWKFKPAFTAIFSCQWNKSQSERIISAGILKKYGYSSMAVKLLKGDAITVACLWYYYVSSYEFTSIQTMNSHSRENHILQNQAHNQKR